MKIIEKIEIEEFRAFHNTTIEFNRPVNAIIGKNGTLKTTLLGMLAHPFSLETGLMSSEKPLIGGKKFNSPMSDKFKFSDKFDIAGHHKWSLYINKDVYMKKIFTCQSILRSDTKKLRFWSTEGREKGMNYIQCPVIYLSMKRLIPLGEEKSLTIDNADLTEEEKELYCLWHNKILISTENISGVSAVNSNNKHSLGPITEKSDAWTISAGQDNIGRIILSVLSMKRLMDKYNEEFKGGIIFIDEIESTLYPAAQEKILDFMFDTAYKYKLQYFFTTHSIMDLSWTTYKTLYEHKVPEFMNNIIVLDGDVKNSSNGWRNYPKNSNIAFLPTELAPERMLYECLFNLDEKDDFWDNTISGYSKMVCFRDYPNHLDSIDDIKDWFKSQKNMLEGVIVGFCNNGKK